MRDIMSPLDGIRSPLGRVAQSFTPLWLFKANEAGLWLDPSDMASMFQDSAGTTPVTAVEQPVGLILDKSGRGNHASQATTTSRPVLSARYNYLLNSENLKGTGWTAGGDLTVTANAATAPNGTATATTISSTLGTDVSTTRLVQTATSPIGAYTLTIWLRAATPQTVRLKLLNNAGATIVTTSNVSVTSTWTLFTVTGTVANGNAGLTIGPAGTTPLTAIEAWGVDLRVTSDGVGIPTYQRVGTSTDYDTIGFPPYLRFDGTDDSLLTSSIDFSGTDAVTVWAGIRKLSDAARGTIVELTASAASNNGTFHLTAPNAASATYAFESKGTVLTDAVASTGVAAPITSVLCASSKISTDSNILRVNGVQADSDVGDQGTGNFSNAAVYIGRRGGSTLPFNGRLHSLIVRGSASTAAQIAAAETWVNARTGAY